jgi:hypothetical protein
MLFAVSERNCKNREKMCTFAKNEKHLWMLLDT